MIFLNLWKTREEVMMPSNSSCLWPSFSARILQLPKKCSLCLQDYPSPALFSILQWGWVFLYTNLNYAALLLKQESRLHNLTWCTRPLMTWTLFASASWSAPTPYSLTIRSVHMLLPPVWNTLLFLPLAFSDSACLANY